MFESIAFLAILILGVLLADARSRLKRAETSLAETAKHVSALQRHAAYPPDPLEAPILWENDHNAISGALRERRLVRMSGDAAWMPANMREGLIVPLRADPRPLGILVLARAHSPYAVDDIEMADVVGTFIGRVVATARRSAVLQHGDHLARSVSHVDREVKLAESRERN